MQNFITKTINVLRSTLVTRLHCTTKQNEYVEMRPDTYVKM